MQLTLVAHSCTNPDPNPNPYPNPNPNPLTLVEHALAQPARVRRAQLSLVGNSVARFHPVASVARRTLIIVVEPAITRQVTNDEVRAVQPLVSRAGQGLIEAAQLNRRDRLLLDDGGAGVAPTVRLGRGVGVARPIG